MNLKVLVFYNFSSRIKTIYLVKLQVTQSCLTLCDPMDYTVHGILQARILGVSSLSLLQGIFPTQESNWGLLHCGGFFTNWVTREAQDGVGGLSLLQWIFLTQELNWDLLYCRCILYQLSYQGRTKYRSNKLRQFVTRRPIINNAL